MTHQQINPPYDGSAPCPGCNNFGGAMAYLHNMFTRWPSGKSMVKLNDMRRFCELPETLSMPHPAMQELLDVMKAMIAIANKGMTDDGLTVKWTPAVWEGVAALAGRAMAALDAAEPLFDAHRHDERHCTGNTNSMWESRGSRWPGFTQATREARGDTSYNYTIEAVLSGGHLLHKACGTRIRLHEHFLLDLRKDPTFYAKVRCPKCSDVPFAQFEILSLEA